METADIPTTPVSDWQPVTDIVLIAAAGKLIEEAGEMISILGRMLIQGPDGVDPKTGKINRDSIADELADVAATSALLVLEMKLDDKAMRVRSFRKMDYKRPWLENLRKQQQAAREDPMETFIRTMSVVCPDCLGAGCDKCKDGFITHT